MQPLTPRMYVAKWSWGASSGGASVVRKMSSVTAPGPPRLATRSTQPMPVGSAHVAVCARAVGAPAEAAKAATAASAKKRRSVLHMRARIPQRGRRPWYPRGVTTAALLRALEASLGRPIRATHGSGDTFGATLDDGTDAFVKTAPAHPTGWARAEADGLAWLAAASALR